MLTNEQRDKRVLGVIFILAGGRKDIPVGRDNIALYMETHGVWNMTDEEWREHLRPHLEEAGKTNG